MAKAALVVALVTLLAAAAQRQTPKPTPKQTPLTTPKPSPTPYPNERPSVKLVPSAGKVTLASECYEGAPVSPMCPAMSPKVTLSAHATDPDGDTMLYTYSTTGGRVSGDGPEVTLDLKGVAPGVYDVKVEVDDGNGGVATDTTKIEVSRCTCPVPLPKPPSCPTVTVSCSDAPEGRLTFTANVTGGDPDVTPSFNWSISTGTISSGQGTGSITVNMPGDKPNAIITATVDVGGYDRSCSTSNSCTIMPGDPPMSRKVDEYGDIKINDEKVRLGYFAVELLNDTTAQGYLICYGGRRSTAGEAQRRCDRAKEYASTHFRGIDARRIVTVDGGLREQPAVESWIVPTGANPPQSTPTVDPKKVRPQTQPRRTRRRAWR
jgi:hypothetical protein